MTGRHRTAVVTIARGRHEHLRGQQWGLARQTALADLHVVVAMGDPEVAAVAREREGEPDEQPARTVLNLRCDVVGTELPLAHARNAGARAAIAAGSDRLVFLDVDCIPDARTVERYTEVLDAAEQDPSLSGPVVASGTVAYLPPVAHPADYRSPTVSELADPHPGRPTPAAGAVVVADDLRLFWSLSFALTCVDWERLGGFSEDYVGYGAEDTDFGQRLGAANGTMLWVGGAAAYHQHHPTEVPPVRHLTSILRNANVFRERWGWFPMEGWLTAFADRGLAAVDPATGRWVQTARPGG